MKIIFMGTPAFAVPSLRALVEKHEVLAVCTQPDRPAGRGQKLVQSPVKILAEEHGIPVLQPDTLRLAESKKIRAELKNYGADVFVVAAYGILLPKGVLSMPPLGCVNVHASLLPKYRGASPIHAALLNGDASTGITIMQMDSGIDTGDIILQKPLDIAPEEQFSELHDRMAALGGEALLEAFTQMENNAHTPVPQDNGLASYAPLIKKSDGHINWKEPTENIINRMRALAQWPGCYCMYRGQPLKIWTAEPVGYPSALSPGTIVAAGQADELIIKTGDGALRVIEMQAQGGKRMPATDYLRGHTINAGEVLG